MLELVIRPEAELDAAEAAAWYECERVGLGRIFLEDLRAVWQSVADHPSWFPRVWLDCRRALLRRYPYGVFFVVEEQRVVVLAVMHLHRNPDSWQQRVR